MARFLYAIQATGNGHLSRARELIPHMMQYGDVDLLVSGTQAEVALPYLIRFRKHGLGFVFGKKGGIDFVSSFQKLKPFEFFKDVFEFPVTSYDLVLNDFEPVTAWACKIRGVPCVAISHQAAFWSDKTPRPETKNRFAEALFQHYAPATTGIGFHFERYEEFIHTPVIRGDVRACTTSLSNHITVYHPAYADELLINQFSGIKDIRWELFSKHCKNPYRVNNISVQPVNNELFLKSLSASYGVITAGGFESVAEASFLGKKIITIPMHNQYEQQCNAEAARRIGHTLIGKIDAGFRSKVRNWLDHTQPVTVNYPDETGKIVEGILKNSLPESSDTTPDDRFNGGRIEQSRRIAKIRQFAFGNFS